MARRRSSKAQRAESRFVYFYRHREPGAESSILYRPSFPTMEQAQEQWRYDARNHQAGDPAVSGRRGVCIFDVETDTAWIWPGVPNAPKDPAAAAENTIRREGYTMNELVEFPAWQDDEAGQEAPQGESPSKPPSSRAYETLVRVPLSELERARLADRMAEVWRGVELVDEERKRANAEFKERRDSLESELAGLASQVREGAASIAVMVKDEPDYVTGLVRVIRVDNGELVRERPMTDEDRQGELFIPPPPTGEPTMGAHVRGFRIEAAAQAALEAVDANEIQDDRASIAHYMRLVVEDAQDGEIDQAIECAREARRPYVEAEEAA